ncbi:MAG: DUF547 domain-containing protein [Synoicihabitans sp.]
MESLKFFKYVSLVAAIFLGGPNLRSEVDHDLFTRILSEHVEDGLVDYAGIKQDPRLADYLAGFARTDSASLPRERERLAFWINAYNAFTLKLVADEYPVDSIHDLGTGGRIIGWLLNRTPWDIRFAEIGGESYTLNEIEHEILRVEFDEPRIHFAIVCAAISCPPLRPEAYVPDRLDAQLDDQARIFLHDTRNNRFDFEKKKARISPIFSWFKVDFGGSDAAILEFVAPFLDEKTAAAMRRDGFDWDVSTTHYDWALNEQ